jgi:hypothetical protein
MLSTLLAACHQSRPLMDKSSANRRMETIENGTVLTQITTRRSHEQPRFAPGMKPEIAARSRRKRTCRRRKRYFLEVEAELESGNLGTTRQESQCSIRAF